jgi:hypothetical protein
VQLRLTDTPSRSHPCSLPDYVLGRVPPDRLACDGTQRSTRVCALCALFLSQVTKNYCNKSYELRVRPLLVWRQWNTTLESTQRVKVVSWRWWSPDDGDQGSSHLGEGDGWASRLHTLWLEFAWEVPCPGRLSCVAWHRSRGGSHVELLSDDDGATTAYSSYLDDISEWQRR